MAEKCSTNVHVGRIGTYFLSDKEIYLLRKMR